MAFLRLARAEAKRLSMPDDIFAAVWGQEWYVRVRPEPDGLGGGVREAGLVLDGAGGAVGGGTSLGTVVA